MKIFLDTNILFSAILFPGSTPDLALQKALSISNKVFTSDYCLKELSDRFAEKFPDKIESLRLFFTTLLFHIQLVKTTDLVFDEEENVRDLKDRPVLRAALQCEAEILITGDKDLLDAKVTKIKIIKASDYYSNY